MKNRLKRKLQIRFISLSSVALILLLSLIIGTSIFLSYRQLYTTADRLILLTYTDLDSHELEGERFFTAFFKNESKELSIDVSHFPLMKKQTAENLAKKVIAGKSEKGFTDSYRYIVSRSADEIKVTFLSRRSALEAYKNNSTTLLIVSSVGAVVMIGILSALSGTIVSPIVRNRQKQKEFISSASHELKTPLTVIRADAQLLESEIGENEWLTDIIKQSDAMSEMTHRLVFLSRAEEQDGGFVKIEFPVSDVAADVVDYYKSLSMASEKKLVADIQNGLSYSGDEKAIREIMTALIDNAFKYSDDGSVISVRLASDGRGILFSVENSAAKVTKEQLSHFGERFYRADTSSKVNGYGIGLSVVKAVAEGHRGSLTASLSEDNKIRFTVKLK